MGLTEKRIISIAGGYFEDIVLYLTRVLKFMDLNTVIADYSSNHRLYTSIPKIKGIEPIGKVIDYRGVGYIFGTGGIGNGIEDVEMADVIIKLYDISGFIPDDNPCIIISDESKRNLDLIETMKLKDNSMVVIRDYTGVIKEKLENTAQVSGCKNMTAVPFNLADKRNAVLAEHNDRFKFTGISSDMKNILLGMAEFICPEKDRKRIRKAYHMAEKGIMG